MDELIVFQKKSWKKSGRKKDHESWNSIFFYLLLINKDRNFCFQILRIVTNMMVKESMTKSMTDVFNHTYLCENVFTRCGRIKTPKRFCDVLFLHTMCRASEGSKIEVLKNAYWNTWTKNFIVKSEHNIGFENQNYIICNDPSASSIYNLQN